MQMKKFINDPNSLTDELLEGLALAHADTVDVRATSSSAARWKGGPRHHRHLRRLRP